jgi:hypothetical protein
MRMTTLTRPVRLSVIACLAVALMVAPGLLPTTVATVPECVTAAQWVRDNADRLPTTADELLQHSPVYRIYIFSAVAPEIKSAMRRQLWTRSLAEMTLTPEQRQVVLEMYEAAVPALYVASAEDPIKIDMRELEARGLELFSPEERHEMSIYYGTLSTSGGTTSVARARGPIDALLRPFRAYAEGLVTCDCPQTAWGQQSCHFWCSHHGCEGGGFCSSSLGGAASRPPLDVGRTSTSRVRVAVSARTWGESSATPINANRQRTRRSCSLRAGRCAPVARIHGPAPHLPLQPRWERRARAKGPSSDSGHSRPASEQPVMRRRVLLRGLGALVSGTILAVPGRFGGIDERAVRPRLRYFRWWVAPWDRQ